MDSFVRVRMDPIRDGCKIAACDHLRDHGFHNNSLHPSPQSLFGLSIEAYNTLPCRLSCSCTCVQTNGPDHARLSRTFCKLSSSKLKLKFEAYITTR